MARNKKEVKSELKEEVKNTPIVSDAQLTEIEERRKQREEEQNLINKFDTEKASKDILVKNGKELIQHLKDIKNEHQRVAVELENKYKALKHVEDEIKAQTYALHRQNEQFENQNKEKLGAIAKKQSDLDAAEIEYKKIISDGAALNKELKNSLATIADERRTHQNEMNRLNKHVLDVEGEDSRLRSDIETREAKLKQEKEEFEAKKEALRPEILEIEGIKNENLLLWQRIEDEKRNLETQKSGFESYKRKLEQDGETLRASVKKQEESLKNEESKLRKWKQDLEDYDLQLKARESEASRQMKKYQLNQVIEANKK